MPRYTNQILLDCSLCNEAGKYQLSSFTLTSSVGSSLNKTSASFEQEYQKITLVIS